MRNMTVIRKRNEEISAHVFLVLVSRCSCVFSIVTVSRGRLRRKKAITDCSDIALSEEDSTEEVEFE